MKGPFLMKKKKFVSLDKQSKKQRRAYFAGRRADWNGVEPVTRVIPSGKAYDRGQSRRAERQAAREADE